MSRDRHQVGLLQPGNEEQILLYVYLMFLGRCRLRSCELVPMTCMLETLSIAEFL